MPDVAAAPLETTAAGHVHGGALLARTLRERGVRTLFALAGGHILPLLDACAGAGIEVVDTRHEGAAALAAEGWALATGQTGVAAVTAGPGFGNALTGLLDAHTWSVPLLLLAGRTAPSKQGRGAVMDVAQRDIAATMSKWAATCSDARRLPRQVAQAMHHARAGCPGPAYLEVTADVMWHPAPAPDAASSGGPPSTPSLPAPAADGVAAAVAALRAAERPLIVVGSGAFWSGAGEEIAAFAEQARIPLVTASGARGVVPDSHPWCLGSLVHGGLALPGADCVLVLGSAFNANVMYGGPPLFGDGQTLIQVDIAPERIGGNRAVDVALCADVTLAARALREAWPRQESARGGAWLAQARSYAEVSQQNWNAQVDAHAGERLHTGAVAREVAAWSRERFHGRATLVADGGDALTWALAYFDAELPGHLLSTTTALGTLGVGMPFALAAQAARRDEPVVVFAGDGSFGLSAMEVDTAVRHRLPIVVVVSNNAGWGDVRHEQDEAFGPGRHVASELPGVAHDVLAQALGGHGEHVERLEELRPALDRSLASGVCSVVDVSTDPSVLSDLLRMVPHLGLM